MMPLQGSLSIERMCQLAQVSRAGFYRYLQGREPAQEAMAVRSMIQAIAVEHRRRYGYRRITAELRRRGMLVNHKRVARMMREDNLLAVQPRSFMVTTTDSAHDLEVFLNLARRMTLTGINQLWVADITYIRLLREFVYLAVNPRRVLAQGGGMGAGSVVGEPADDLGARAGDRQAAAAARVSASFRSWRAVRLGRVREAPAGASHDSEHESASEPLRQRELRKLCEDTQARGNLCERLSNVRTPRHEHRTVHRAVLQSVSLTLGARLPATGGVRTRVGVRPLERPAQRSDHPVFQSP
jgi:HTH-like domain